MSATRQPGSAATSPGGGTRGAPGGGTRSAPQDENGGGGGDAFAAQVDGVLAVKHETKRRQVPGGEGFARCLKQDISAPLQAALGQSVVRGLVCGFGHGRILNRRNVDVDRSNIGAVAGPASTS